MHNKGLKFRTIKCAVAIPLFIFLTCQSVTTNLRAEPTLFDTFYYIKRLIFQSAASVTTDGRFLDTYVVSDIQLSGCTIRLLDSRNRPAEYVIDLKDLSDDPRNHTHQRGKIVRFEGRISVNGNTGQTADLRLASARIAARFIKSINHAVSLCRSLERNPSQ